MNKKIKVSEAGISYKKGFKWITIEFGSISNAYMRAEEVSTGMKGKGSGFVVHFLMLQTESELIKLGIYPREDIKKVLEYIKEYQPQIQVGYTKKEDFS